MTVMKQSPGWHEVLGHALDRQLVLLSSLEELSEQQRALIDAEDPEPLLELMNARQQIVDELVILEQASAEARTQMHAAAGTSPNAGLDRATRESLQFRLGQVASRAKAIMQRDAKDAQRMQTRKKKAAEELAELAGAKKAVNAYAKPPAESGAVFQDREG
jgi:flagellar biosynthesis/type III secretory pathway chaperone